MKNQLTIRMRCLQSNCETRLTMPSVINPSVLVPLVSNGKSGQQVIRASISTWIKLLEVRWVARWSWPDSLVCRTSATVDKRACHSCEFPEVAAELETAVGDRKETKRQMKSKLSNWRSMSFCQFYPASPILLRCLDHCRCPAFQVAQIAHAAVATGSGIVCSTTCHSASPCNALYLITTPAQGFYHAVDSIASQSPWRLDSMPQQQMAVGSNTQQSSASLSTGQ